MGETMMVEALTVTYEVTVRPDGDRWRASFGQAVAFADEPQLAVAGVLEVLAARIYAAADGDAGEG